MKLLGALLALLLDALRAVPASAAPTLELGASIHRTCDVDPCRGAVGPGRHRLDARERQSRPPHARRLRDARQRTLELVSPEGLRYELFRSRVELQPKGWLAGDFYLSDVDPTRRTALLVDTSSAHRQRATELDLVTGGSRSLRLPFNAGGVGLRPDGAGILVQTVQGNVLSLGWTGGRTSWPGASRVASSPPRTAPRWSAAAGTPCTSSPSTGRGQHRRRPRRLPPAALVRRRCPARVLLLAARHPADRPRAGRHDHPRGRAAADQQPALPRPQLGRHRGQGRRRPHLLPGQRTLRRVVPSPPSARTARSG